MLSLNKNHGNVFQTIEISKETNNKENHRNNKNPQKYKQIRTNNKNLNLIIKRNLNSFRESLYKTEISKNYLESNKENESINLNKTNNEFRQINGNKINILEKKNTRNSSSKKKFNVVKILKSKTEKLSNPNSMIIKYKSNIAQKIGISITTRRLTSENFIPVNSNDFNNIIIKNLNLNNELDNIENTEQSNNFKPKNIIVNISKSSDEKVSNVINNNLLSMSNYTKLKQNNNPTVVRQNVKKGINQNDYKNDKIEEIICVNSINDNNNKNISYNNKSPANSKNQENKSVHDKINECSMNKNIKTKRVTINPSNFRKILYVPNHKKVKDDNNKISHRKNSISFDSNELITENQQQISENNNFRNYNINYSNNFIDNYQNNTFVSNDVIFPNEDFVIKNDKKYFINNNNVNYIPCNQKMENLLINNYNSFIIGKKYHNILRIANKNDVLQHNIKRSRPVYVIPPSKKRAVSQGKPLNLIDKYYDENYILEDDREDCENMNYKFSKNNYSVINIIKN